MTFRIRNKAHGQTSPSSWHGVFSVNLVSPAPLSISYPITEAFYMMRASSW